MPILKNINYLATCREQGGQSDIQPIENAAVAWEDGEIVWLGKESEIPEKYANLEPYDAGDNMVIPGLIDCHTHLAFGGWRSDEFEMRVRGDSYLNIAKAGGGILSTVKNTRKAAERELYDKASNFLDKMIQIGVTAVECKSGYGLNVSDELKLLRVYRRLAQERNIEIIPTFLGAHTFPPEFENDHEGYVDLVIDEMIPAVAREELAEYCDIFVEDSAFSISQARRIFGAGKEHGLTPKLHADQLTDTGGAELAAEVRAVSADHLEKISDAGIFAMAQAGVIGVTLPLASLYTQQQPLNCRRLIDGSVEVAVATDFNPGSAPSYNLPLAMMLACNMGRLTPAEALKGATIYAAKAINRQATLGSIEPGKKANFTIIDAPNPNFWMYHYRPNCCKQVFINGQKMN